MRHNLQKSHLLKYIISYILIICGVEASNISNENNAITIMENEKFIQPLLRPINENEYNNIISKKDLDPLHIGSLSIAYFFYGKKNKTEEYIQKAESLLKVLDDFPYKKERNNSILYLYDFDDRSFKAKNWWSGMANASVALSYLYGYKITGNIKYKISAIKALNGVVNLIEDNGSAISLDINSSWYLEFADINSNIKNSGFVLNGFQFTLLVIKIFEEVLDNDLYKKAYLKGMNGFKFYADKFYMGDEWIFYMLNPLTPTPPHYAIYDSLLISSLLMYDNTNQEFLSKELQKRKTIFRENYNLEKYKNGQILFSAIGPPNPFWIDLYPTILKLKYNNGTSKLIKLNTSDFKNGLFKRSFKLIADSKNIESIEVLQKKYDHLISLYSSKINDLELINEEKSIPHSINTKKIAMYDMIINNKNTYIKLYKNKDSKAVVRYVFDKPIKLLDKKYFAIFLDNKIDLKYIQVTLIDVNNKAISRYYPPQDKGSNNLILLSPVGFKGYPDLNKNIKEVRFYLGAHPSSEKKSEIELSSLFYMDSNKPIYDLLLINETYKNRLLNFKTTHTD